MVVLGQANITAYGPHYDPQMDTRELEGFFWNRKEPRKVPGRLHLEDDGFRLTVDHPASEWGREPSVLLGDCLGYPVTLFNGFTERISSKPYGTALSFGAVVLGDHLPSLKTPRYRSIAAQVEYLDEFVGVSGLRFESNQEKRIVEWEPTSMPSVRLREVQVALRDAASFDYISDFEFRLAHGAWITFSSTTRKSLETWRNRWLGGIESLIAMGMDTPSKVICWTTYQGPYTSATPQERAVEIFMRSRPNFGSRYPKTAHWQPFFSLTGIGTKPETILRGFYRFRQRFPQPAEILFEYQVLAGALTPSDRFLYMSRFLESFHRIKQVHSTGRREGAFRNRLVALFTSEAAAAEPWLGAVKEDLAELVVNTRNYYVHYNPKGKAKAVHDFDLDELGDRLWQITRACILHEIGVSDAAIGRALDRDPLSPGLRSTAQKFPH